MNPNPSRRDFLRAAGAAALGAAAIGPARGLPAPRNQAFSFLYLGDLHYDKEEHHDREWVRQNHPGDWSQIQNYSRITRDIMPALFATVGRTIADWNRSAQPPIAFVLQAGDVVEGLCGSEERATRQSQEALAFVRGANLGVPFLFTKGNHDVTGDGAREAYRNVFHPFLTEQRRRLNPGAAALTSARFTMELGNSQWVFFDAYEAEASLEWFVDVAARRTAENLFVVVHPPVVPYGARADWAIYSAPAERTRREKFLELLGAQRAIALGGHIHKYNSLARSTPRGTFGQFAISSVISTAQPSARTVLSGVRDYTPDQIRVEPHFGPGTEEKRRAIYVAERPFIRSFDYADLPGYAIVTVDGRSVSACTYGGVGRQPWKTCSLSGLLTAGAA